MQGFASEISSLWLAFNNKVVIKRENLMVLIGFNYLETPGKQVSLFKRGRQENDGCKEKIGCFACLNSKVKKKKRPGFFGGFTGEHRNQKRPS